MTRPRAGHRFDDPTHVQTWQRTGRFPKIHDAIGSFVREEVDPADGMVLDICCSSGLLGRRLASYGYQVCFAQEPAPGLDLGRDGGVYGDAPVFDRRIVTDTTGPFLRWLQEHEVRTIVARRCISELFTSLGGPGLELLATHWVDVGVQRVVLQGRARVPNPTHPVPDTAAEIRVLGSAWRPRTVVDPLALLVPA